MFKGHQGKAYDLLLDALNLTDTENEQDFRVLNHGFFIDKFKKMYFDKRAV